MHSNITNAELKCKQIFRIVTNIIKMYNGGITWNLVRFSQKIHFNVFLLLLHQHLFAPNHSDSQIESKFEHEMRADSLVPLNYTLHICSYSKFESIHLNENLSKWLNFILSCPRQERDDDIQNLQSSILIPRIKWLRLSMLSRQWNMLIVGRNILPIDDEWDYQNEKKKNK